MSSLYRNFYRTGSHSARKTVGLAKTAAPDESSMSKYLPYAAGAAALGAGALGGGALYKHLRKFKPSEFKGLRSIQEAAQAGGDHFTRVIPETKPTGKLKQMWDKLRYGADELIYHGDPSRTADIPGILKGLGYDKIPRGKNQRAKMMEGLHAELKQKFPDSVMPKFDEIDISKPMRLRQEVPGAVRQFGPFEEAWVKGRKHTGAGGKMEALEERIGEDKWKEYQFFQRHAPGSMPETVNVGGVIKDLGYKKIPKGKKQRAQLLDELQAELRQRYPEGFIMKELGGVQSGGIFPTHKSEFSKLHQQFGESGLEKPIEQMWAGTYPGADKLNASDIDKIIAGWKQDPSYAGRVLQNIMKDPRSAIVQRNVNIEKPGFLRRMVGKAMGQPASKEVRVHVEGGRAIPELAVPRFDPTMGFMEPGKVRGAAEHAQGIIDKLPKTYGNTGTFAMDIAPLEGGGYTLIEANPGGQSGLLFRDPTAGPKLRKALTGRWGPGAAGGMAAAGATGIGLGAGAGTYGAGAGIDALQKMQPKEKGELAPPSPPAVPGVV